MIEVVSVDAIAVFMPRTNWDLFRPLLNPGVYRLKHEGSVVYIGQSKNVGNRIRQHWTNRRWQWHFDAFDIEWCEFSDLHRLERRRIKEFLPKHNKLIPRKPEPASPPSALEVRYKSISRLDEHYIPRAELTLDDRQFHIMRLRKEADMRLRHAAELEAETAELFMLGAFDQADLVA